MGCLKESSVSKEKTLITRAELLTIKYRSESKNKDTAQQYHSFVEYGIMEEGADSKVAKDESKSLQTMLDFLREKIRGVTNCPCKEVDDDVKVEEEDSVDTEDN